MASRFEKARTQILGKSTWDSVFKRIMEGKITSDEGVVNDPYDKSDLVYVCISTTARAISQVPLVVSEFVDGKWKPTGPEHPLQALLDYPNSLVQSSPYRFIESAISFYMLDGNVCIIPFPPGDVFPIAFYTVRINNMELVRNPKTRQVDGWIYKPEGDKGPTYPFSRDEVIHMATWNPKDTILGQRPLDAGAVQIRMDYKSNVYNENFFEEACVPSGNITTPPNITLTDPQYERLRQQIEGRHKGYQKSHKVLYLERGLKYEQMSLTHQDMQFAELKTMTQEAILRIYGMKKSVISVTDDLNYATSREQKKEWWNSTNLPIMSMFTWGLTNWTQRKGFFKGQRTAVDFDTSNISALHDDFSTKTDMAYKLHQMGFTADEINQRLEMGFDDKPWRKHWWVNTSLVPAEFVLEGKVGEGSEKPRPPEAGKKPSPKKPTGEEGEEIPEYEESSNVGVMKQSMEWKSVDEGSSLIEEQFQKKVSRFMFEMRKRSLSHLLVDSNTSALIQEQFEEERKQLAKWVKPLFEKAVKLGARTLLDEVGKKGLKATIEDSPDFDADMLMEDRSMIDYITSRVSHISGMDGITKTIKRRIVKRIAEGLENGETVTQIADRIRSEFQLSLRRSVLIAQCEVFSAVNKGRHEAMLRTRFQKKTWVTMGDHRVRMTHRPMDGQTVGMDEPWVVGGFVLRFPCDYEAGAPEETIGCRCIEIVDPDSFVE